MLLTRDLRDGWTSSGGSHKLETDEEVVLDARESANLCDWIDDGRDDGPRGGSPERIGAFPRFRDGPFGVSGCMRGNRDA